MDNSPHLDLPFIAPSQAQKHITHNEAVQRLDDVVHIHVQSRALSSPPSAPTPAQRYVVASNADGAWEGHDGDVALYRDTAWDFIAPKLGWIIYIEDENMAVVNTPNGLEPLGGSIDAASQIGINTTADSTNRFAVKSDAVLFSHDDVTPGNGDIRMTLNKAGTNSTAAIVYQNDYSGRAECGLAGGNDFQIKVTADGQNWTEALRIDGESGAVNLPQTMPVSAPFNLLKDSGRFAGSPDPQGATISSFTAPSYFSPYNGAVFQAGPKFIHNNTSYGGTAGTLDPVIDALISRMKTTTIRRYGIEFYSMKVTAGSTQAAALSTDSGPHYLSMTNKAVPIAAQLSVNYHIHVTSGSVAIGRADALFVDGTREAASVKTIGANDGWQQITQVIDKASDNFVGYDPVLLRIYASVGAVYHIAAPVIMPGAIVTRPGLLHGIVPSLDARR